MSHPNILELYDWFDRRSSYVMAMERPYPCQDLFMYCQEQGGVLNEDKAHNVTRQLLGRCSTANGTTESCTWFQEQKFLAGPGTVWSVGVTLYEIVCGNLPFTIFSSRRMQQAQFPEGLSPEIKDFIGCYLRPHAEGRSTLDQLQLHPWHRQSC
ncbi:hypothetical protein AAFF_G00146080 [Aldrovandia affinis]|uniref:non-specific serine/threonine protein kinase n=1 Tax=Aldrovandia affinis TaxID=143900 RepID=A0AAD7T2Q8_9TELE|nr:hypothetical protein AAFF_G00146080 [Aldrovandia affinis]